MNERRHGRVQTESLMTRELLSRAGGSFCRFRFQRKNGFGRELSLLSLHVRGAVNCFADALIGAAAANVAAHGVVNIGVGGFWFLGEQGDCGHDLAGLAVTALGNIFFNPGFLDGVRTIGGEAFNGKDFLATDAGDGSDAGASGFAVDVNGASTAESHAATEFRARHVEGIAQYP